MEDVLFYLLVTVGFINLVHFGLYLVGANIYDIQQFRRQARQTKGEQERALVTVLVPAHNEELSIIRCLDSIRKSTYRKLQILVVDDASTDRTGQLVRWYIAAHPYRNIELLRLPKNLGKAAALNYALSHATRGEFTMTLDADSILGKEAVANAMAYFRDPTVVGVAANVRVMHQRSALGLLQRFEHMIGYRSKKLYTLINSEFIVGGVASTYRYETLQRLGWYDTDTQTEDIGLSLKISASGNRANKLVYAADVVAMTEGVQTFKALFRQRYRWKLGMMQNLFKYRQIFLSTKPIYSRSLTFYRIPMAVLGEFILLLEPIILGYVIYLSISHHQPGFIIGAYITIMLYLVWTVWHDEHLGLWGRLSLSMYMPLMYFIFYIMNIVQFVAVIRCLLSPNRMMLKTRSEGTWVSPKRSGSPAEAKI